MRLALRLTALGIAAAMLPFGVQAGESVTYSVGGAEYEGYSAPAQSDSRGLVLIIHDWDGLTGYEERRAEMLAEMGYDAFAVDLFGKGNRPESVDDRRAETGKLYGDREKMRSLLMGGLEAARERFSGQAVVMGYCFGGAAALEMARAGQADGIAGYVSFHGGLTTPEGQSYAATTPPLLIAHGGADSSVTMDHVAGLSKELEAAGVAYEIQVYSGAPHAFTVFDSQAYREVADTKSWQAFQDFLAANLVGS
jgi:dienelactone hydrolase